ncbi:hypothetical protein FF86_1001157, partial [Frankia sp. CpI1-P]
MLMLRRQPLGVPLHHRRVRNVQLAREVVHHHPRHLQRIAQERPQETHRPELNGEPQPRVLAPVPAHELPVGVIQEEEPLQLSPHRLTIEPPVRRNLLICEELHRHTQIIDPAAADDRAALTVQSCAVLPRT